MTQPAPPRRWKELRLFVPFLVVIYVLLAAAVVLAASTSSIPLNIYFFAELGKILAAPFLTSLIAGSVAIIWR